MQNQNKQRWLALWERIRAQGDGCKVYEELVRRYKEPHRCYHTLKHIKHCLTEFDPAWHLATSTNADAVRMALWFHDAVYDTKANDNEEKSAELAKIVLEKARLSDEFINKVVNLIMATKHAVPPVGQDEKVIADIDLSSLGLPPKSFIKNTDLIRKEYPWATEEQFSSGRRIFLASLLRRPSIYSTPFFYDKYEAKARRNIKNAICRLSS